ncbi:M20/M25/M40 family metallo-hydrolase [Emcibacter nanhaiensis]|uniref:M20/M25/M40 family metallo-hydrolase n=1 Tax=Emcibacter nanhaiensis TaxID=1505037 RepID=UPI001C614BDD|nr:M20/M25/M40 family metallo-hydrolase [Emcibacter nanhaiensis]
MTGFRSFFVAFVFFLPAFAANCAEDLQEKDQVLSYIDRHFEEQISFLEKVVNINSGTRNISGVRKVGEEFAAEFEKLGFKNFWIKMPFEMKRAGHLYSQREGEDGPHILLIGHLDTVFSKDSDFQKFTHQGNHITGPGVVDMKGGDVVMLYALKALHACGILDGKSIKIFLTGDEENVGPPLSLSRRELIDAAKQSDMALSFESGQQDQAVIARRGASLWSLGVSAKRAHSSTIFSEDSGDGAIYETARILKKFHKFAQNMPNLTLNPAVIAGGTSAGFDAGSATWTSAGKDNIIPQVVESRGDLRFISREQLDDARAEMRKIIEENLPHTSAEITFTDLYPAMSITPENKRLLGVLDEVSQELGYGPVGPNQPGDRGAGDISFVAPHVASIDALGPWGGGSHTTQEWLDTEGFRKATKRTALLLYQIFQSHQRHPDGS